MVTRIPSFGSTPVSTSQKLRPVDTPTPSSEMQRHSAWIRDSGGSGAFLGARGVGFGVVLRVCASMPGMATTSAHISNINARINEVYRPAAGRLLVAVIQPARPSGTCQPRSIEYVVVRRATARSEEHTSELQSQSNL